MSTASPRSRLERLESRLDTFEAWAEKRRTLFWTLHSLWALCTGVVVVALAHERYAFVPWVVAMLLLTWVSTVFFSRRRKRVPASSLARLGDGFLAYLTRVMYQETLFFLLPFYAYSTCIWPVPAWNVAFLVFLGGLAVLSCLDLVFDRMLRESRLFALVFFSAVAFAALNFLLPGVFGVSLDRATRWAAWCAVISALPISFWGRGSWRTALGGATLGCMFALGLSSGATALVPPVPLRLQEVTFARRVEREPLRVRGVFGSPVSSDALEAGRLAAVARIFAPTRLPAEVLLIWELDGEPIRESRPVDIVGHRGGFRVWDALVFETGRVPPGRYRISALADGRLLGRREILVTAPPT